VELMDTMEPKSMNNFNATGPKTAEGKAIVARNAIKHGSYSEAVPVLGEDPGDFEVLHDGIGKSLLPVGPLEEALVDRLARLWWRIQRVGRAEREGLRSCLERELRRCNVERATNSTQLAYFLNMTVGDSHHAERLQRHEAQLERSFFRILHELERLQARRMGQGIIPPLVLDMSITKD